MDKQDRYSGAVDFDDESMGIPDDESEESDRSDTTAEQDVEERIELSDTSPSAESSTTTGPSTAADSTETASDSPSSQPANADEILQPATISSLPPLEQITTQLIIPRNREDIEGSLPYIYDRNGVQANRDPFSVRIQSETERLVRLTELQLSELFPDDDIKALDVREALLLAGLYNLDDLVSILEEWGYGER